MTFVQGAAVHAEFRVIKWVRRCDSGGGNMSTDKIAANPEWRQEWPQRRQSCKGWSGICSVLWGLLESGPQRWFQSFQRYWEYSGFCQHWELILVWVITIFEGGRKYEYFHEFILWYYTFLNVWKSLLLRKNIKAFLISTSWEWDGKKRSQKKRSVWLIASRILSHTERGGLSEGGSYLGLHESCPSGRNCTSIWGWRQTCRRMPKLGWEEK